MRDLEYPFIGYRDIKMEPVASELEQYETLWAHYESKIRTMVHRYQIVGAVGADAEDLMGHARLILLQAIRTHDAKKGAFSTHYYTLLHHHFQDVKRKYPSSKWLVMAEHPGQGVQKEVYEGFGNLQGGLVTLRAQGFRILSVINKTPNTRGGLFEFMVPLQKSVSGQSSDTFDSSEYENNSHTPENMQTHDEEKITSLLNRVFKTDRELKRVAYLLYSGCSISSTTPGSLGILQRLKLRKRQFDRALAKIQMLLEGELGAQSYKQ